jgi:hypothetical protein
MAAGPPRSAGLSRATCWQPWPSRTRDRATAIDPAQLTRQQAAVAQWIARRYKVAPEPIAAWCRKPGRSASAPALDPTLILAIMAIESSFNPFAQSPVGAQGLMQVMTRVHDDKYEAFGGNHAAFDPVSNLRVGVQVLKDCIARAGSLQDGLRYYVGAANIEDDGGYAGRVLPNRPPARRGRRQGRAGETCPTSPAEAPCRRPRPPAASAPGGPADRQVALLR